MYYDDILFRNKVLSKIFYPNKQLYLDLIYCQNITGISTLFFIKSRDKNKNFYFACSYFRLSYCDNITDVSALGNVNTFDLNYCYNIIDVNELANLNLIVIKV